MNDLLNQLEYNKTDPSLKVVGDPFTKAQLGIAVKKGDKEIGLIIDSLIGQQEIVIKSLGRYLNFVKQIAGATILGNGGVALIIDTNSLF